LADSLVAWVTHGKLTIPAAAKASLLASLEDEGVDARSIYPDLYGLGLHLSTWQRRIVEKVRP